MDEKPPPTGVAVGPLMATLFAGDGVQRGLRQDFAGLLVGFGAALKAVPLEGAAGLLAGGFEHGDHLRGDFRADTVAGDEGDLVGASRTCGKLLELKI